MTSLLPTSLYSGGYYSIPTSASSSSSSTTGSTSTTGSSSTGSSNTASYSPYAGLSATQTESALFLNAEASGSNADGFSSDTVSLSDNAQNYLSDSASVSNPDSSFVLSSAQQQELTSILQKYQSAPNTQQTFNEIQDALKTAGLSPDELAAQDLQQNVTSSNTQELLTDFNGGDGSSTSTPSITGDQTKANNYIQQVYTQFERVQGLAASSTTSTTA